MFERLVSRSNSNLKVFHTPTPCVDAFVLVLGTDELGLCHLH